MADILLLGTPYVRRKAVDPGKALYRYQRDAIVAIGDTCPGKELRWVDADGLLVAQGEVLTQVGVDMLAASGLINERVLTIDGADYQYRLLHVIPGEYGEPCEWEVLQQAYPGVWIFDKDEVGFWGNEGAYFNKHGFSDDPQWKECRWGWRPVLKPIIRISPDMVGKCLFVSTGMGCLQGELAELTDYDLVFRDVVTTNLPPDHILRLPGGELVLERKAVRQLREV